MHGNNKSTKGTKIKVSQFKDYSELPLFLNAELVAMEVRSEQDKQKLFPHTQRNFFSGIISWQVRGVRLPAPL